MFVIEVKPTQKWRFLKMNTSNTEARAKPYHSEASHFFTLSAADLVAARWTQVRYDGKLISIDAERRRIVHCDCAPSALR